MAGYAKASDALLERRPDVGQEILEFPVVQLFLSGYSPSTNRLQYFVKVGNNVNCN